MSMLQMNAESFMTLPCSEREDLLGELSDQQYMTLKYDWNFWARPDQLQPSELGIGDIFIWLIQAGRGYGKTRTLAEWVRDKVQNEGYRYISLVGAAADEVRNVMIEGESGLLAISPPWFYPEYEPSKKRLTWPNGAIANIFYGSEPDKSRGAQSDLVWMDEIAKWRYPEETFDNVLFGARLGNKPLVGVSTTPRPTKFMKELVARNDVVITKGSSYDNVLNLAKPFLNTIIKKYKGTRLGLQEIEAKLLDDNPSALWKRSWIDRDRVYQAPRCHKIVIGIDPQASAENEKAETGIVVVGIGKKMPGMAPPDGVEWDERDDHYYVFDDLTISGRPNTWAKQALAGYNKYHCDALISERNNGGDMIKSTLRNADKRAPIREVWASKGKYTRAEPISLLAEQGYVHHVGNHPALEDELCEWVPGDDSPNRLDAYVWAMSYLSGNNMAVNPPSSRTIKKASKTRSRVAGKLPM